jgi:hypothetical protein
MKRRAAWLFPLFLCLSACSHSSQRGIADRRSDFGKFLPMTGDPARYGLKAVRPYFRTANRNQILHAIETACVGNREGSSIFKPESQAGYYVNCNPRNRQLLNGYVSRDPRRRPHS